MQFFLGVIATCIGVVLAYLLDGLRNSRSDKKVLQAFRNEVLSNIEILSANSAELEDELEMFRTGQEKNTTLWPFSMPTWQVLSTRMPKKFTKSDTFNHLALTMHFLSLLNENMRAREQFKINGISVNGYINNLKQRDKNILDYNERLLERLLYVKEDLGITQEFSFSKSKTLTKVYGDFKKD